MFLTVVFCLFIVFTCIQIIYYLFFATFLFKQKKEKNTAIEEPISVIIFAKNEASNLQKNLPSIIEQQYSKFEIVIINNASSDNTDEVLESFKLKHSIIKIINVENNEAFWANKKYALTLGIKAAKYNHLLFTEANCKPVSKNWITKMSCQFNTEKNIVIGYSKFKKENTLTNILIRFDNLLKAIKCFGFTKMGSPFMAFNTNFAYHRDAFFKTKGFINHIKIKGGEADLFIKDAANRKNTSFSTSEGSFTEKKAPESFFKWYNQKKKVASIKKQYSNKHRFLLGFFTFTKVLFYALAITLLLTQPSNITLLLISSYFLIQFIIVGLSAKKLKEPILIYFLPFLEICLLLIQISIFIANFISKPKP